MNTTTTTAASTDLAAHVTATSTRAESLATFSGQLDREVLDALSRLGVFRKRLVEAIRAGGKTGPIEAEIAKVNDEVARLEERRTAGRAAAEQAAEELGAALRAERLENAKGVLRDTDQRFPPALSAAGRGLADAIVGLSLMARAADEARVAAETIHELTGETVGPAAWDPRDRAMLVIELLAGAEREARERLQAVGVSVRPIRLSIPVLRLEAAHV